MAKDNNTLIFIALGGLAFYFWQRSKNEQPTATSSASTAVSLPISTHPGIRDPSTLPVPMKKPKPRFHRLGQTPGIAPPITCENSLGIPCRYVKPVVDYYTPEEGIL